MDDTAVEIGRAAGVVPNADFVELLRLLNPHVDVFSLPAGAAVVVPALPAGMHGLELRVDDDRKLQLRAAIAAAVAAAPTDADGAKIVEILRGVDARLAKRTLVTTPSLLADLRAEADAFGRGSYDRGKLVALLAKQTAALDDEHKGDLPVPANEVAVVFRTVRHSTVVTGWQIWYQPMFTIDDSHAAERVGELSTASVLLAPSYYAFWATHGNDPRHYGVIMDYDLTRGGSAATIDLDLDQVAP